jgi:hypothetical protein
MILLVGASSSTSRCAGLLEQELGIATRTADSVRQAITFLRRENFAAVVIDQVLLDADPASVDALLRQTGTAIAVFFNPAIQGSERVVREVRSALQRRQQEQVSAMQIAARSLRNELKDDVTGILLSSQLALAVPSLPPAAEAKLRSVAELAERIRARLIAAPESRARASSSENGQAPMGVDATVAG